MSSITKGQIGAQDLHLSDGSGTKTFTRLTSDGNSLTLNDATFEVDALVTFGGGSRFTKATIDAALAVIGTTNKVTLLLRPGTWVISTDADYSAYKNVTWKVPAGTVLQIATTKTLTIGGPFEAGLYQVFSCTGTGKVVFGNNSVTEVFPEWWGAIGDGATDNILPLTAALTSYHPVVLQSNGTYYISAGFDITIPSNSNISVRGSGPSNAVIKVNDSGSIFSGTKKGSTTLKTNATLSKEGMISFRVVTVTSAANIAVGDLLVLTSDESWPYDNADLTSFHGEINIVESISGDEITLRDQCSHNYLPASNSIAVDIYGKSAFSANGVSFENVTSGAKTYNIALRYLQDNKIINVHTKNSDQYALYFENCFGTLVDGARIENNASYDGVSPDYSTGVWNTGSSHTKIVNSHFLSCVDVVLFGGTIPSRHCIATGNTSSHDRWPPGSTQASAYATHGGAEHILFSNNIINGAYSAFLIRSPSVSVIGNHIAGAGNAVISISDGDDIVIKDNTVIPYYRGHGTISHHDYLWENFVTLASPFAGQIEITGNTCKTLRTSLFAIGTGTPSKTVIKNNTVEFFSEAGAPVNVYLMEGDSKAYSNVHVTGNTMYGVNSQSVLNQYGSSCTIDFSNSEADNWTINAASALVASGGTLANVTVNLRYQSVKGVATVTGALAFDTVTNPTKIYVSGIRASYSTPNVDFYGLVNSGAGTSPGLRMIKIPDTDDKMYVSFDNAAYDTAFPAATGYIVPINITYRVLSNEK